MQQAGFLVRHRKTLLIVLGNLVALLILMNKSFAQEADGYIYGRVETYGNTYQGQIRWGKEEAFWNDFFNASKVADQSHQRILSKEEDNDSDFWDDLDWSISSIWDDKRHVNHEFSTQFGNISKLTMTGKYEVDLELKNGKIIPLSGRGYNDIGTKIVIFDEELGEVDVEWRKVREVDFMATPKRFEASGGGPIFGTVETYRRGTFTGYIQWDHDERLGDDKLDGDSRDGDLSIAFNQIKSIEKEGNSSFVTLNSGRDFYLRGSNDVGNGNRGIIVTVPDIGKIDIPWRVFRKVEFEKINSSGASYNSYKTPRGLMGTVYTFDGDEFEGRLVYDVDEAWEVETLEAKDDDIDYIIPFNNIKVVAPKNSQYCTVQMRNGDKLLLGDRRDVSEDNDGILVFTSGEKDPVYIKWRSVSEIIFD